MSAAGLQFHQRVKRRTIMTRTKKQLLVSVWLVSLAVLFAPSATVVGQNDSAALQEVAQARNATAKYHDVNQALADGYVNVGYIAGEGFEYLKRSLIDCTFDLEHPEAVHYIDSGNGLRLVGVEYIIPIACTATQPAGFSGDSDEWEFMAEGFPIWALNAWLWLGNPNGIFAERPHPRIP
jgi:hypothetical protein